MTFINTFNIAFACSFFLVNLSSSGVTGMCHIVSVHLPFPLKRSLFDNGMAAYIVIYITGMFHIASKKLQLINHSEHLRHGGHL